MFSIQITADSESETHQAETILHVICYNCGYEWVE
jgi:hypothetical protein